MLVSVSTRISWEWVTWSSWRAGIVREALERPLTFHVSTLRVGERVKVGRGGVGELEEAGVGSVFIGRSQVVGGGGFVLSWKNWEIFVGLSLASFALRSLPWVWG